MKILFVSALLPYPLFSGGQIRVYNLLKILSRHHEITLLAFIRRQAEVNLIKNLAFCQKVEAIWRGPAWQPGYVIPAVFGKYPLLFSTYNNRAMRQKLVAEFERGKYNLVHAEPGYVWPSLPKLTQPLVVAEHNIESTIYEGYVRRYPIIPLRPLLFLDVIKLKYWETRVWHQANHIVTVSTDDANVVRGQTSNKPVSVIPNGIDPLTFPFKPRLDVSRKAPIFLFVGNFSWLQNRDAIRYLLSDLWQLINKQFPDAKLRVVGRQMPQNLRELAGGHGIQILDHVSDITQEYHRSDIMLAPIRVGGGTKFKILEAMASGIPVITTTRGAQGLDVTDRREIIIADSAETTVKAVNELLTRGKRKTLVTAARKLIESAYTWEHIARKLETVWQGVYEENY